MASDYVKSWFGYAAAVDYNKTTKFSDLAKLSEQPNHTEAEKRVLQRLKDKIKVFAQDILTQVDLSQMNATERDQIKQMQQDYDLTKMLWLCHYFILNNPKLSINRYVNKSQ